MTSRISLCKQIRQDSRHQLWIPILAGVVYLIGLVALLMYFQASGTVVESVESGGGYRFYMDHAAQIRRLFGSENTLLTLVSCTGGLICGLALYSFLFNRAQTDFFMKLPVTRSRMFIVRWLEGLLYYTVPTLIFYVLALVVCIGSGYGGYAELLLAEILCSFLRGLICFLVMYHTAILAAMLCGQILVALCAFGVLSVYAGMLGMLVPTYLMNLTDTFRQNFTGNTVKLVYLCPVWLMVRLPGSISQMGWYLILAALLWAVSWLLYQRRPAERAGSALAFTKTRGIIRVLISVCAALYIGLLLRWMTEYKSTAWLVGGTLLGLLLCHGLIETIFDFDVKSALHHPISLAGCALFCLAFIGVFYVGAPDQYLPRQSQVASVGLSMDIDRHHKYLDVSEQNNEAYYTSDYLLRNSTLEGEDLQLVYDLIETSRRDSADRTYGYYIDVDFRMKSGHVQKRTFRIDKPSADDAVAAIFDQTAYKETYYQILSLPDELFGTMTVAGPVGDVLQRPNGNELFNAAETSSFLEIYREELRELTYEDLKEMPAAEAEFSLKDSYLTVVYGIYPAQKKSLAWLKEQGIDPEDWKEDNLTVEILDYTRAGAQLSEANAYSDIIRLGARLESSELWYKQTTDGMYRYTDTVSIHNADNGIWPADDTDQVQSILITDPEEIKKLLPQLRGIIAEWEQNTSYVYLDRLQEMDTDHIIRIYTDAEELDLETDSGYKNVGTFVISSSGTGLS